MASSKSPSKYITQQLIEMSGSPYQTRDGESDSNIAQKKVLAAAVEDLTFNT